MNSSECIFDEYGATEFEENCKPLKPGLDSYEFAHGSGRHGHTYPHDYLDHPHGCRGIRILDGDALHGQFAAPADTLKKHKQTEALAGILTLCVELEFSC